MPGQGGWEAVVSLTQKMLDGLDFLSLLRGADPYSHRQSPVLDISVFYNEAPYGVDFEEKFLLKKYFNTNNFV